MAFSTKMAVFVTLLAGLLPGCATSSQFMYRLETQQPRHAAPGKAKVVFIRPSYFASAMKFMVFDHHGQFVGESLPKSHFSIDVPPGRHIFIVWAENTATLKADLAAGCTYFVEVAARMGVLSARGHLLAIKPQSPSWRELDEWIASTKVFVPNQSAGQAYLMSRHEDLSERIRRGLDRLSKYDSEELAERTITPRDGICSPRPTPASGSPAARAPAGSTAPSSIPPPPPGGPPIAPPKKSATATPPPASQATGEGGGKKIWLYARGGKKIGPESAEALRNLFQAKQINGGSLVWRSGLPAWIPLSRAPEFGDLAIWFYAEGQTKKGPISTNELRQHIKSGRIKKETLIWRKGLKNWQRLDTLPAF